MTTPRTRLSALATGVLAVVLILGAGLAILFSVRVQRYEIVGPLGLSIAAGGTGALVLTLIVAAVWRPISRAEGFGASMTLLGAFVAAGLPFLQDHLGFWDVAGMGLALTGGVAQVMVYARSLSLTAEAVAAVATIVGVIAAANSLAVEGVTVGQTLGIGVGLSLVTVLLLLFFDYIHPADRPTPATDASAELGSRAG